MVSEGSLTNVSVLMVFDDLTEFKVASHYCNLQMHNKESCSETYFSVLISSFQCLWSKYLPEKGSDRAYSLPPCLLPCTAEHGHSSPTQPDRKSGLDAIFPEKKQQEKHFDSNNILTSPLYTCLIVEG